MTIAGTANYGKDCTDLVKMALTKAGYYHIDCAEVYKNSASVGDAWISTGADRKDIYLTTKGELHCS